MRGKRKLCKVRGKRKQRRPAQSTTNPSTSVHTRPVSDEMTEGLNTDESWMVDSIGLTHFTDARISKPCLIKKICHLLLKRYSPRTFSDDHMSLSRGDGSTGNLTWQWDIPKIPHMFNGLIVWKRGLFQWVNSHVSTRCRTW